MSTTPDTLKTAVGKRSRRPVVFELLGWPEDGPTLRLDYRTFSYAGKFAMSNTGKAVCRTEDGAPAAPEWHPDGSRPPPATRSGDRCETDPDPDPLRRDVLAAAAFNEDRTAPGTLWIRYVTVHTARRGDGIGPTLLVRLAECADERGYDRLRIAVNNPFAYDACYKAGFEFTGRETGVAELVLERPASEPATRDEATYKRGIGVFTARDLTAPEREYLTAREGSIPPPIERSTGSDI